VREEKTVASHLERLLTDSIGGPVGVVNTGVGSYNTVQQERFLTHYGLGLHPDAVLLLYVPNDVQVHPTPYDPWSEASLRGKPPLTALDMLSRRSWVVRLFHHMRGSGRYGPPLGGPGSEGWVASLRALKQIQETCEERGVPFIPVFFRLQGNADTRLLADVRDTLRPLRVHDTAPWFDGITIAEYVNSKIDSHPNRRAHRVMAAAMAPILASAISSGPALRSAD
jgi:hypothetical protein